MKFLVVLIIIFFYRNWIGDNPLREAIPFSRWSEWFRDNIAALHVRYLLCTGIPVVLVALVFFSIHGWLLGLPWIIFAVLVMAYCIDVVDFDEQFDDHAAYLRDLDADSALAEVARRQDDFKLVAVYEVFQSLYPTLFWFLLVGPAGPLFYILSRQYLESLDEGDAEIKLVGRVVYVLEWPAAKVTGFVFALAGHFGKCFEAWIGSLLDTRESIASNLVTAACAASSTPENEADIEEYRRTSLEHNEELKDLLVRTSFGWLGIAAVVTILGL